MIESRNVHVIEDQFSAFAGTELWYGKKGNTLYAGRGPLDSCEHEMHHIFNGVVIRSGNKYFLPANHVVTSIGGLRHGRDISHRTSCLGFGQGHGALPLTRKHLGNVCLLQRVRPEDLNEVGSAVRENGIDHGGIVGCRKNEAACKGDHEGELLASHFRWRV